MDAAAGPPAAAAAGGAPEGQDAPSAAPKAVQAALRDLLPSLDMNVATERQIRGLLEEALGAPMDPHKKLIKQEIDAFLTESLDAAAAAGAQQQQQQGSGGSDEDDADFEPEDEQQQQQAAGKRKRAQAAGSGGGGKRAKAAGAAAAGGGGGGGGPVGGVQLDTQGLKWLSVSTFKGQQRVDLRVYYRTAAGELAPTKKGISMSGAEWAALCGVLPALAQAVQEGREDFGADLPNGVRATTSIFQGKLHAGIREYYDAGGGDLKPGRRGINLLPDQVEALREAAPGITQQLPAATAAAAAAAAPAAAAASNGSAGGAAAKAAPSAAPAAAPAAAGGQGGGAAQGGGQVDLGGRKRAAISTFTGSACVDLRECYEKDGQLLPGKKGIMLRPDQWRALAGAAADISAALGARNTGYRLSLSNKRAVSISEFKGAWYVGVREYYETGGQLKPGAKGLNMTPDQWRRLVDGMQGLDEALAASGGGS